MRKPVALIAVALALASLVCVAADRPAWSQAARTIRVILTVPPGGSIDILFRLLADQISSTRGQTIIIESRPGAGGTVRITRIVRAACDHAERSAAMLARLAKASATAIRATGFRMHISWNDCGRQMLARTCRHSIAQQAFL